MPLAAWALGAAADGGTRLAVVRFHGRTQRRRGHGGTASARPPSVSGRSAPPSLPVVRCRRPCPSGLPRRRGARPRTRSLRRLWPSVPPGCSLLPRCARQARCSPSAGPRIPRSPRRGRYLSPCSVPRAATWPPSRRRPSSPGAVRLVWAPLLAAARRPRRSRPFPAAPAHRRSVVAPVRSGCAPPARRPSARSAVPAFRLCCPGPCGRGPWSYGALAGCPGCSATFGDVRWRSPNTGVCPSCRVPPGRR